MWSNVQNNTYAVIVITQCVLLFKYYTVYLCITRVLSLSLLGNDRNEKNLTITHNFL